MLQDLSDQTVEWLGVSGALWKLSAPAYRDVVAIKQRFGLSEIVAQVLAIKQIPLEDIESFLNPTLKLLLPDPFHLLDMNKAVERVCCALKNDESVVIFGDYDVDGATSSAMLKRYLNNIGIKTAIYIPDRIEEGYGPNAAALTRLRVQGYSLCITVDCGTVAHEPLAAAKSCGLDVIVVDHHMGANTLPDAVAVINPNRLDESSEYTYLSGVGTSFMLLVALHKTLRQDNFFLCKDEPDLMCYLDLVALGTVCDVMPMLQLNRAFVKQGLRVLAERKNVGLRVLSDIIGINEPPTTYHLGFSIGPHINAGGRVGNSSLGARLLSSDDPMECANIATMLVKLNSERKEIEMVSLEEATIQAEKLVMSGKKIIMVAGNWHVGVIGIVAGRLKERFFLPAIVISLGDGEMGKASARSVPGVDIGAAVLSAKLEGMIPEGGGHAMAAGFSVHKDSIDLLYEFLLHKVAHIDIQKCHTAYGVLGTEAVSTRLCRELQLLEPYGSGNPEPRFILKNVRIKDQAIVGATNIRCSIDDGSGSSLRGICFKCVGSALGESLLRHNRCVSLLGKVSMNYWRGNEYVQFVIDDLADTP